MNSKLLFVGITVMALCSCTGNNDANQQAVIPAPQEQPVQAAPVDSTMAQPQAQPDAAATAATAQALPEAISTFIKQQFPNATVVGVEPDHEHGGLEYDVYLNDGTQIDFDANNQWEKVESMKGVPAYFIPKAIANHVRSSYQNIAITKINKEYHGYDIELANGMELTFDRSGRFLGMDD